MRSEPKRISRKSARKQFTTVGLALTVYILAVLVLPVVLKFYFANMPFFITMDDYAMIVVFYFFLLIGTIVPFAIVRKSFGIKISDYFRKASMKKGALRTEFCVFFSTFSLAIFIMEGISNYFGISVSLIFNIGSVITDTYFDNWLYIFIFILASPIVEEIAFRGCLLRSLSRYGKVFSIAVTSIIFALAHGSFIEMIPAFCMGVALSLLCYKYHSVEPCIFIRIVFNAVMYCFSILPDEYRLFLFIPLLLIYLKAIIAIVKKNYRFVTFKFSHKPWKSTAVFLTTPTVIFAIVLFIVDSVFIEMFF